jgi:GTP pyrophosphokinase
MLSARFEEALAFAARLHREQKRKGSDIPYVAHLLAVASFAIEHGADEDEAIAALLHDAVEDQGGSVIRAEIERRFGPGVAGIVDECSDTDQEPKPPWRERKDAYLAHLASASRSALLVTACDKLHNVRSILADYDRLGEELWKRFNGGREGTLWYYRSVVDALAGRLDSPVVDELRETVEAIEERARRGLAAG